MDRLYQFEQILTRFLEAVITILFFFILALTITLVIMRYGFNSAIIGGNEAMDYLFIYTTALGAAVSIGKREHIKITFFVDQLNPKPRRIVNIINYLLIGFINGVMVWYSLSWIQTTGNSASPVLRIANWIVQISVPIGCSFVMIYCLNHILFELFSPKYSAAGGKS